MPRERVELVNMNQQANPLKELGRSLNQLASSTLGKEVELPLMETPETVDADYGLQLIPVAKAMGEQPIMLASKLSDTLTQSSSLLGIAEIKSQGPFLNIKLEMNKFGEKVTNQALTNKEDYGKEKVGEGNRVVIDMSSPNVAKRMNYGHLRSTIIGDALASLYRSQGYEVIRDNHIGDWGTQFGKQIVAIKKWGSEEELLASEDPIGYLQDLYVRFHSEAEEQGLKVRAKLKKQVSKKGLDSLPELKKAVEDVSQELMKKKQLTRDELNQETILEDALDRVVVSELEKEGREWFKKLETGDEEAHKIWKLCIELSMKEFESIYNILGVGFEKTFGESFYEPMLQPTIEEVKESGISKVSEGALVVDNEDEGLGVSIIQKSDGASVYMTRDLACAIHRETRLKADKAVYVVGEDQKLYFQQLFATLRKMGHKIGENAEHVYFGMVRLPEGKMSTRKGRTVLLKDVIEEGFKRAEEILSKRNPDLFSKPELRNQVVRQVAVGALKWNDLAQDPRRPIVFQWEKALSLEGYSAPYVQYAGVRIKSILKTVGIEMADLKELPVNWANEAVYSQKEERLLVKKIAQLPYVLKEAMETNTPSKVATYIYEVAKIFNLFYTKHSVLKAENKDLINSRIRLAGATLQTLENSLGTLGIEVPDVM